MSDPRVDLVVDLAELAREFVRSVGLPGDTPVEPFSADDPVPSVDLTVVLRRARKPQRVDWWRRVATAWLDAGQPGVAEACVERARQLILTGVGTSWETISSLARLSATIDGWTRPTRQRSPRRARLAAEAADPKRARVAAVFHLSGRDGPATSQGPWRAEDVATLVVRGRTGLDADIARVWYEVDEHHLLVEHLLVTIAGRPMAKWLHRYARELVWCGRSLLRLGDPATAWACFWLAVGMVTTRVTRENSQRYQHITVAREHLRRLGVSGPPATSDVPDRLSHPPGTRLGTWLLEHQIEGAFGGFEDVLRRCEARGVPGTLERQRRYLGQHSGWFLPTRTAPDPPRPQAWKVPAPRAAGVVAPPPRPHTGEVLDWSPPAPRERDGSPPQAGSAPMAGRPSSVPVGFLTSGTVASVEVTPGGGVMLLGPLATPTAMRQIAAELAMDGWTVVYLTGSDGGEADGAYEEWHRLTAVGRPSENSRPWASELVAMPHVRRMVRDELVASLPECADLAATACVADLVDTAHARPGWYDALTTGDLAELSAVAAAIVDAAADLPFQHTSDFRRAALLLNHTVVAASTMGRALSIRWREGAAAHAPVFVDTAGPKLEAAIRLAVVLGSLARAWSAERPAEHAPDAETRAKPGPEPAGMELEIDLAVQRRPDPADVAELIAAVEAADRSDRPRRAPAADTSPEEDAPPSPWLANGVIDMRHKRRPVCVVVHGGLGDTWPVVAEWIASAEGRTAALVIGAEAADAWALAQAARCDQYIVGRLPGAGQRLVEIAAGIRLPHAMDDIDKNHGLIVDATAGGSRSSRFAVWPSRHRGTWSQ